jgi:glyoxylase-like metal-dependent hydrolase (beta-lactamase superfamily II)
MITRIFAQERGGLHFEVFAGSAPALSPNCAFISGERDAILIDVQFVLEEARELAERIKDSGKQLKAAFITHAHPDHYGGMGEIQAAFPDTPILAGRVSSTGSWSGLPSGCIGRRHTETRSRTRCRCPTS